MQIQINHNGTTNAEVLGISELKVKAKALVVLGKWEHQAYRPASKIYEDIFKPSFLNDMEKIAVFHIVCNILREEFHAEYALEIK